MSAHRAVDPVTFRTAWALPYGPDPKWPSYGGRLERKVHRPEKPGETVYTLMIDMADVRREDIETVVQHLVDILAATKDAA